PSKRPRVPPPPPELVPEEQQEQVVVREAAEEEAAAHVAHRKLLIASGSVASSVLRGLVDGPAAKKEQQKTKMTCRHPVVVGREEQRARAGERRQVGRPDGLPRPITDDNGEDSGSAHVFARSGDNWSHQAKLLAPDGAIEDTFGSSVAIYEDIIVVGAKWDDDIGEKSGSAHVFARSGEDWTHQAKLLSPEGAAEDELGESVAIFEDTIVLGAQYDQENGANSGSAHVFVRSGEIWTHQAKLLAPDGVSGDLFGDSVAIYEDTVVLGAYLDDDKGDDSGSAYVFHRSGETWTYQAKLLAQDGSELDSFGCSVAIYGDSIVVGAIGDDHNDNGNASGSAYVFRAQG
ncbi:hypothetical protein THAOC_16886, partial [Thalassiosira oceanica]